MTSGPDDLRALRGIEHELTGRRRQVQLRSGEVETVLVPLSVDEEHAADLVGRRVDVENHVLVGGRGVNRLAEHDVPALEVILLRVAELRLERLLQAAASDEERKRRRIRALRERLL